MSTVADIPRIERLIAGLEPARKAAQVARGGELARYGLLFLAYLAALAAAVVGTIWLVGRHLSQAPLVFGAAGLLAGVLVTGVAIKAGRAMARRGADPGAAYEAAHFETLVLPLMREALPGCTVLRRPLIDTPTFDESRLFAPHHEVFEGRCGVEGVSDNTLWRASVLRVQHRGRDRHGGTRLLRTFAGVYLHVVHPGEQPQPIRLVDQALRSAEERFALPAGAVFSLAPEADPAFTERFVRLVPPKAKDLPLLPAAVRHACLAVCRQLPGPALLSFTSSGVHVAIPAPAHQLPAFEAGGLGTPDAGRMAGELDLFERLPAVALTLGQALSSVAGGARE